MPHLPARIALSLLTASLAVVAGAAAPDGSDMLGFTAAGATSQHTLEQEFDAKIHAADQRDWMKTMASQPNHVGSAHDKANAEFMLQKFRSWGWDAQIETFSVLYPTLTSHTLELVAPTRFTATLAEPPIAGDATSTQTAAELAPYTIYGADGDVTADLVYVNYGMPDDYKELARRGISVDRKSVG